MMRISGFIALWLLLLSHGVYAQSAKENLWLFSLENENGHTKIIQATKLTDNAEYSNQPHFSVDGSKLYYSQAMIADEGQQTDAFVYDIVRGFHSNLTRSPTSEYSPTPRFDGNGLSVILVDSEGQQWLWGLSFDGSKQARLFRTEPVGYHVWINEKEVLAFVLGDAQSEKPHTLQRLSPGSSAVIIDQEIGASLWAIPGTGMFSYTKNPAPDSQPSTLMGWDPELNITSVLTLLPDNVSYMAWTPRGEAIIVKGSAIWRWKPEEIYDSEASSSNENEVEDSMLANTVNGWEKWLDISNDCPNGGSRLHMSQSGSHLAVVCQE
ncbi:TolB family protein [Alteromonas sp. H39]|uniref:TolB family protein n=1 Tax=Alteromonas sp. H39 TaxID=3389876 RepID=UPI0039E1868A